MRTASAKAIVINMETIVAAAKRWTSFTRPDSRLKRGRRSLFHENR